MKQEQLYTSLEVHNIRTIGSGLDVLSHFMDFQSLNAQKIEILLYDQVKIPKKFLNLKGETSDTRKYKKKFETWIKFFWKSLKDEGALTNLYRHIE